MCSLPRSTAPIGNRIVGVKFGDAPPPSRPFDVGATLRISKTGAGSGTVRGSGLDCGSGAGCRQRFEFGELIQLEAVAAEPGSRFGGWVGVCGGDKSCSFNVGPVTSVQARFVPAQPPPPPPPQSPPPPRPPPPPPPAQQELAVRITSLGAARANGRWRVAARVETNQRIRVRGRVGRGRATWADRTLTLQRGATTVRLQLPRKATAGTCWVNLVARNADGEVRTLRRTVRLRR